MTQVIRPRACRVALTGICLILAQACGRANVEGPNDDGPSFATGGGDSKDTAATSSSGASSKLGDTEGSTMHDEFAKGSGGSETSMSGEGYGGTTLKDERVDVEAVSGWEGGLPQELFDYRCERTLSYYEPDVCQVVFECEDSAVAVGCGDAGAGQYECFCSLGGIVGNVLFRDRPYEGDDFEPCRLAAEDCSDGAN